MHFLIKRLCFCLLFLPEFGKRSRFFRGFFVRFLSLRFGHAGTTESRFFGNFIFFRKFFFGFRSFVDCLFCVFFVALFNIFGFGCLKVRAFLPHFFSSSARYTARASAASAFCSASSFSSEETHFSPRVSAAARCLCLITFCFKPTVFSTFNAASMSANAMPVITYNPNEERYGGRGGGVLNDAYRKYAVRAEICDTRGYRIRGKLRRVSVCGNGCHGIGKRGGGGFKRRDVACGRRSRR